MTFFEQLSSVHQAALLCAMFLTALLSLLCLCLARYGKRNLLHGLADSALFLVLFTFVLFCSKTATHIYSGRAPAYRFPVPVWFLWCFTVCAAAVLSLEAVRQFRRLKSTVGPHSVKDAIDTLPGAVCFFNPGGTVKLCNLQMHRLYRTMAQSDLQSLSELLAVLHTGGNGVKRLSDARQAYLFPDGRVWRYAQTEVTTKGGETYTESLFYDITQLYEKNLELKERNAQLKEIYCGIKQLSDNVLEMTRESEILAAKTDLHDQMGAGIAAIRQSLRQNHTSAENAEAIALLYKAVKIIKNDNESPIGRTDMEEFIHNARAVGITVEMTGSLPEPKPVRRLFLLAMKECCTNAARHADARTLWVRTEQTQGTYRLHIENDGTPPQSEIQPKGGLLNLKRSFTQQGGTVIIQSTPQFALSAAVPAADERKETVEHDACTCGR